MSMDFGHQIAYNPKLGGVTEWTMVAVLKFYARYAKQWF
jgi:hypothetical protein